MSICCCCYRKGTNFQANHNQERQWYRRMSVVVATAKVQIFKQITTANKFKIKRNQLLLLPQRYKFSSKSQQEPDQLLSKQVVVATAKVQIFKQITTNVDNLKSFKKLLLLPQRYKFSSKSQLYQYYYSLLHVVVATAKVQIFKQITTKFG